MHECTKYFDRSIFARWLPDYDIHIPLDDDGKEIFLSPHHFGWPLNRPRRYTVLTRRSTIKLEEFSSTLKLLFRKVNISVKDLMVAPEEPCGYSTYIQFVSFGFIVP